MRGHRRHFLAKFEKARQSARRFDVNAFIQPTLRRRRQRVVRVRRIRRLFRGLVLERGGESQVAVVVKRIQTAETVNSLWQIGGLLTLTCDAPAPVSAAHEKGLPETFRGFRRAEPRYEGDLALVVDYRRTEIADLITAGRRLTCGWFLDYSPFGDGDWIVFTLLSRLTFWLLSGFLSLFLARGRLGFLLRAHAENRQQRA